MSQYCYGIATTTAPQWSNKSYNFKTHTSHQSINNQRTPIQIYLLYRGPICRGPICRGPICHTNIFHGPNLLGPNLPKSGKLGPKKCWAQFATKSARGPICIEPVIFVCSLEIATHGMSPMSPFLYITSKNHQFA